MARFVPNLLTLEALKTLKIPAAQLEQDLPKMVRTGMERVLGMQAPTGGWTWYGNGNDDLYMTACVVEGLEICKRHGFAPPEAALQRGRARLKALLAESKDLDLVAYGTSALGEGDWIRLEAERGRVSPFAKALWVRGLAASGRAEEARTLARELAAAAKDGHWEGPGWHVRNEDVRVLVTAQALRALAAADPGSPALPKALDWMLSQQRGGQWRSTRDTAIAVVALLEAGPLDRVAGAVGQPQGPSAAPELRRSLKLFHNDREAATLFIDLNAPEHGRREAHLGRVAPGVQRLRFEAEAEGMELEAELIWKLVSRDAAPPGGEIEMTVAYERPLHMLRRGEEIEVVVTVDARRGADYAMVLSPIPAGCEVVRGSGRAEGLERFEDRHEKALFFVRRIDWAPLVLRYRMRCLFEGRYTVQPGWAGSMYSEERFGGSPALNALIAP